MNWTEKQAAAIHAKPCTLLVSAAAGSGKTAVLTERIVEKLCDGKDPLTVENLAVVTFTKAAAGELKERIYKKLASAVSEDPKNRRLSSQLFALPSARISTIHSFCFRLIRENTALLSLSPAVSISDPVHSKALLEEAAKNVLSAYYTRASTASSHDPGDFLELLELLSPSGKDKDFLEGFTELYLSLRSYPSPLTLLPRSQKALEEELRLCREGKRSPYTCEYFVSLAHSLQAALQPCVKQMQLALSLAQGFPGIKEKPLNQMEAELSAMIRCRDCEPERLCALCREPLPTDQVRFPQKTEEIELKARIQSLRNKAKEGFSELRARMAPRDESVLLREMQKTLALSRVLQAMLTDLEREYRALKDENAWLDYGDLEQYCARLLCENITYSEKGVSFTPTATALRLREEIRELYVDEYQDTNLLQDMIFRAACKKGNLFLVGDPKQSIYGFRGAKPEIFIRYKNSFAPYTEEEEALEQKLMLSNNFRCDKAVIRFTNRLFSLLMNTDPTAPLYGAEDELIFSKSSDSALPVELLLLDEPEAKGEEEEEEERSDEDPESLMIARRILALLRENILTEKGSLLRYGDIAVLARSAETLKKLRKVLKLYGIPCSEDADDSFFESPEVLFLRAFLTVLDNPHDDIAMAATLNSPVFAFTPDELLAIRREAPAMSFYHAALQHRKKSEKLQSFFLLLEELRGFARNHSLCDTVLNCLWKTDAENIYAASAQPLRVRDNIRTLLDLTAECERNPEADLAALQSWLDAQKENKSNTEDSSSNAVKLMTIHHSKGLEFPCVIVAGLSKRINKTDLSKRCLFDPHWGVATRIFDEKGLAVAKTAYYAAIAQGKQMENLEEEKRVLYVALTRARQKLILTGCITPKALLEKLYPVFPPQKEDALALAQNAGTLLDLVLAGLLQEESLYRLLSSYPQKPLPSPEESPLWLGEIVAAPEEELAVPRPQEETELSPLPQAPEANEELKALLDFEYPFTTLSQIPKKLSVSALTPVTKAEEQLSLPRMPEELFEEHGGAAFAGTAAHQFMQFCDFAAAKQDCRKEAQRLRDKGFLSEEQWKVLSYPRLQRFFASPLYRELSQSRRVHRELRFNVFLPANRLMEEAPEQEVLLQGVIDCFFENPDGSFTLLDFKTDRARGEEGRELLIQRHSRQLQIYRLAVEKMTEQKVSKVLLWSFSLGEAIEVEAAP